MREIGTDHGGGEPMPYGWYYTRAKEFLNFDGLVETWFEMDGAEYHMGTVVWSGRKGERPWKRIPGLFTHTVKL